MLPENYFAYRFFKCDQYHISGLSEGYLWDFLKQDSVADLLLEHYGIPNLLFGYCRYVFGPSIKIDKQGAAESGFGARDPILYRRGITQ